MEKLISIIEKTLVPVANKLSQNKYLNAISGGCMSTLGIIMLGAVFTILTNISWQPYTDLLAKTGLGQLFTGVQNVTTNLLAVYMAFAVGYRGATVFGNKKYTLTSGFLSLFAYMLLIPLDSTTLADSGISFFNTAYLGTKGVFVALLAGLVVSRLLALITEKNIVIKLPDSVPEMVSESLSSLLAGVIITIVFLVLRALFAMTAYGNATDCIYTIIQTPLQSLTGNLPAFIIVILIAQLLWFFGIHGDSIVNGVMTPIFQVLQAENQAASLAGQVPPNIICQSFWDSYASIGIIGSIIAIVLIAKSKRYIEMKKIAAVPYIFNVGEPTLFGIPLMMNVTYFIPFILSNVASIVISYAAFAVGLVPKCTGLAQVPWTTPLLISGYLTTNSIMGAVLQLVCLIAVVLIWVPFVKVADQQILKEEAQENK